MWSSWVACCSHADAGHFDRENLGSRAIVSIIVKAEGPSGRAKIRSDDPKHALGLAQYLRTIGYNAWIEDTNGNEIDEKALQIEAGL